MHAPTIASHEAYARTLRPLAHLQAAHAFVRAARGDAPFPWALAHWTMLLGAYLGYGLSPAEALRGRVTADLTWAHERHAPARDLAAFERQAAPVVDDLADDFLRRWLADPPPDTWYGCFRYDVEPEPGLISLHFYNAVMPVSPFADPEALADDLRQCLLAASRQVPDAERLQCGSWVNNLPPIRAVLPRRYVESLAPTDPDAKTGLGWWGQFVTSEGTIHTERAERLLATGEFRYPRLLGRCTLGEALAHLGVG